MSIIYLYPTLQWYFYLSAFDLSNFYAASWNCVSLPQYCYYFSGLHYLHNFHHKIPDSGGLNSRYLSSMFWGLKVWGQGASMVKFWGKFSFWFVDSCPLMVSYFFAKSWRESKFSDGHWSYPGGPTIMTSSDSNYFLKPPAPNAIRGGKEFNIQIWGAHKSVHSSLQNSRVSDECVDCISSTCYILSASCLIKFSIATPWGTWTVIYRRGS